MKILPLLVLLLFSFSQCKKDGPEPLPEVASIVGKWQVATYSHTVGDSLVTKTVGKNEATLYEFRYDGVILNGKGYMPCCLPQKYTVNGKAFEATPLSPAKPDPSCILVDCAPCANLVITTPNADGMVIEFCNGFFLTLVREK